MDRPPRPIERKLNAIKKKSLSQPDIAKLGLDVKSYKPKSVDDEIFELCALSGVKMDKEVFLLVIDLLRLNVNPNVMMDIFRKMCSQCSGRSSKSSDSSSRVGKSNSDRTANYSANLLSKMDMI